MSLVRYKQKRRFDKTPEPQGGAAGGGALHFVVQQHAASHLHYDFRLEMDGVLKSWAIPKGPSLNPDDKRLAMQVEDHPYDYKDFEGVIPGGNYGAGTVIVWDEGTYEPLEEPAAPTPAARPKSAKPEASAAAQEKRLLADLKKGSLKIRLHGHKLKGEFALVHIHGRGDNAWLLIKHRDKYASDADVTRKNKSVLSGKTLAGMAKDPKAAQWGSPRKTATKAAAKATAPTKRAAPRKKSDRAAKTAAPAPPDADAVKERLAALAGKRRAAMPKDIDPMLATLVDKPFDDPGWIYEVKWDGYRSIAYVQGARTVLRSRNNKAFEEKYYPIKDALEKWPVRAVIDGEIVVTNDRGQSDFNKLQNWRSEADGPLHYYVFDLLWLEGYSLLNVPLTERKELLKSILPETGNVHYSEGFATKGTQFFRAAEANGLEGMIAKEADSLYHPGARSNQWLKVKTLKRQEVVIGGYTRNAGSPKLFSALLVGVYDRGKLVYTGKIGTGFDDRGQREMMKQFKPLETKTVPFAQTPNVNSPSRFRPDPPHADAVWLKPKLVCEVTFRELTEDGVMRHPSFQGMREDKAAGDVHLERAKPTDEAITPKKSSMSKTARATLINPTEDTQTKTVDGHELSLTHMKKVYWPKEGYTKGDVLNYYYKIAPYILPYMTRRPQSLNRFPDGINGEAFYQKDVTGKAPDWAELFPYHAEGDSHQRNFLVCNGEASLLWMANQGCIEMNPWSSTVDRPDNPDWCVIDLDPTKKNDFDNVIQTALVTRQVLDAIKVPSYPKTTGSTGIHIYIPLGGKYTYEQSKEFARVIVKLVGQQLPDTTTIERTVSARKNKIYLDFLQNRPQATLATVYSLRPKPGATISMPLHWEEVKKGLKMTDYTIGNVPDLLKERGDIFKPVLGKGIDLDAVVKRISSTFGA
ncbi:MAG TPA: DNA ligase D [Dinghuibacter sp.]|uniref:DNA ligase D n=1 Tax=Dinghuibacter sp. TaxID=2024697 RepID=UPI002BF13E59|nr:DNA ligase D [Dinghuibacter sp.]HTJ11016.1 DNA ligase D [Dinghuibacter sp.]